MYDKAFTPISAMFHKVFRRQALVNAFKREGNCGGCLRDVSEIWIHGTIGEEKMAKVLISYKILPSEVTVDLNLLKEKIKKKLPKYASIRKFAEEPIAYGLVALIAHITIPEEKPGGLDELEKSLQNIEEISQIETLMVHRV